MKQTNQNFGESSSVQETQVMATVFSCTEIPGRNPGILYHCFALREPDIRRKEKDWELSLLLRDCSIWGPEFRAP